MVFRKHTMRNAGEWIENKMNTAVQMAYAGVHFSSQELQILIDSFEQVILQKNEYVIRKGEYNEHIIFLEKGLLCYSLINPDNERRILDFILPESITQLFIYSENLIPVYDMEALQKSIVWRIKRSTLLNLCKQFYNINILVNIFLEQVVSEQMKRILFMMDMTPQERYEALVKDKKEFIQMVPLKYVASYIGVTPQALSRIRKRLSHSVL